MQRFCASALRMNDEILCFLNCMFACILIVRKLRLSVGDLNDGKRGVNSI